MALPVLQVEQMREWEQASWATGQTEAEVIRQVGWVVAERLRSLTAPHASILILAGKGHNGDDARAAATFLTDRRVQLLSITDPESALPVLASQLAAGPEWIVDGLFGIGLNRALSEPWQQFIATINAAQIPVLALDVPSGLNAATGENFGACIQATLTLTVGAPKVGLLAAAAVSWVGRLEVAADVGLIPCPCAAELNWTVPADFTSYPPLRPVLGHKGSFGHATIIAGSHGYHGAAVLATRGAQRAQPGLTTLLIQENVFHPVAAQLQSAMVQVWTPEVDLPENTTATLIGPGLADVAIAETLRKYLRHLWRKAPFPVVADASALTWLESHLPVSVCRVMTPHPGEAARMLQTSTAHIQADRVSALRRLSKLFGGAWVVLKGHETLIGRSEGKVYVNSSGNPYLAQGGSGDLLAGYIAGLLAQPALQRDVEKLLRYAVWQHGAAADRLQSRSANWTIEDLAIELGNAR